LQMLEGLCHLHSQGISHGDIYAHNTMINGDFELLFGDFGAATNLNALSELHRGAMERVEVRAFACLLEDLYGLLNDNKDSEIKEKLNNLIQAGMSKETWRRPSFEEMKAQLEIPIKAM